MNSVVQVARGWRARLALGFEARDARTRLTHRAHVGPLLVQRAFYPEGPVATTGAADGAAEPCHVYIIHPPGGIASGDDLRLDVDVRAGAHALLTTPAAAKFYRRGSAGLARVEQALRIESGVLEWLPQESIFYPDAAAELLTIVRLPDPPAPAVFMGWEMACLGLPACEQDLNHGSLQLRLELWRGRAPLLLERLNISQPSLAARWGLGGHVAFGTALAWPAGKAELDLALEVIARQSGDCAQLLLACTLIDGVLVCRATARRTDRLKQAFVNWWQALRPVLLAREAVIPRIWST
jgi:urease accessory protein